jgi:hypothetical protein
MYMQIYRYRNTGNVRLRNQDDVGISTTSTLQADRCIVRQALVLIEDHSSRYMCELLVLEYTKEAHNGSPLMLYLSLEKLSDETGRKA